MGCLPTLVQAQLSELYLSDRVTPIVYVVQNGRIVRQFNRSGQFDGPGCTVTDTVKFIGQDGGRVGQEYTLDGAPLDGRYTNPRFESLYDGATDGERNWSIGHNDFPTNFAVVQGDADWDNVEVLFVPLRRSSGITYDGRNGTLWVTNTVGRGDRVQEYDLNGNLISEFNIDVSGGYGIAWDPADDTLWIPASHGNTDLFQYEKDGTLLQRVPVQGLTDILLGAEFGAGGTRCTYTLRKSKPKGGCGACPQPGESYRTQEECETKRDCRKSVKTTIACPGGGNGTCKIKAKKRRCE
ncbi:MAG: hypothetical protein C4547_07915 [Phycisphaerales bacterium]|nr:MAG: hypothetical protein C4547_07915 [Phycisphaerales bacterium]